MNALYKVYSSKTVCKFVFLPMCYRIWLKYREKGNIFVNYNNLFSL